MAVQILLVEDEPDQREIMSDGLQRSGYEVHACDSKDEALRTFTSRHIDLAVLDVILGEDYNGGFDLCRELLDQISGLPVIMLTTRTDDDAIMAGYRHGAVDYLSKPTQLPILSQKVDNLMQVVHARDKAPSSLNILTRGPLMLDVERMEVEWADEPVNLTLAEFRILEALVREPGVVLSYERLMDAAESGHVTRNTINTHIRNLRNKFKAVNSEFASIKNEWGTGYKWTRPG